MFLSLFFSVFLLSAPLQTEILFVPNAAEETLEMLPVWQQLKQQNIGFRILPLGVSKEFIDPKVFKEELVSSVSPEKSVQSITPLLVVTGVSSDKQREFLEAYEKQGVAGVAYWDHLEPSGDSKYFEVAERVQQAASWVLFPSRYVACAHHVYDRKCIVGKPTLVAWERIANSIDRSTVFEKIGLSAEAKTITFIATFGEAYQKAFQLFIDSLIHLSYYEADLQVIICIDPQSDGKWERKYCENFLSRFVNYEIVSSQQLSLIEAVAVSDLVATYDSLEAFPARAIGKQVVYMIPAEDAMTNTLLEWEVALKASDPCEFSLIAKTLGDLPPIVDLYAMMGMPRNSVQKFVMTLKDLVRK